MKDRFRERVVRLKVGICLIIFFLVNTFSGQPPLQASEPKTNYQVEYVNDKLTINVDNLALGSLLATIREKTGIEFVVGQEQSERLISIQFGPLPLAEGLKRMLSHCNHAFLFGPDNKPIKVVILGYATSDSSSRPREVIENPSVQRVISPSSTETMDIKPPAKEGVVVTSSSEIMDIKPSTGEGIIPTPSLEIMAIKPSHVEGMIVTPSTRTMAFIAESMIIRASTGESKPKVR